MKFFVDTADTGEIEQLAATGLLDGVTTNPSLIAKSGKNFLEVIAAIAKLVDGPVSAEVVASDAKSMLLEAERLLGLGDNIAVKVPLTMDGLRACKTLSDNGVMVNVTLCFSATQALLAAKAGAAFVSPFVGRHDDFGFDTEILVASVRHPVHVLQAAKIGADVATMPPAVIRALAAHPLTDRGLEVLTLVAGLVTLPSLQCAFLSAFSRC